MCECVFIYCMYVCVFIHTCIFVCIHQGSCDQNRPKQHDSDSTGRKGKCQVSVLYAPPAPTSTPLWKLTNYKDINILP